ncbi:hypothetical protein D3C87_1891560 [compost metagenome]|jgi:hypothetical protein
MEKRRILNIGVFLLVVLGIAIIYFGMAGPKIMWPPVITGIGFFVISWVFTKLKEN